MQTSCSVAETTKKLNEYSVVQHKNRELKQAGDTVGTHVWTKSITSNILNTRGEALLRQEISMVNEYAYAYVSCTNWYVRHTKPKTTDHRVKPMYQRFHIINAISTSQGK